MFSAKVEAVYAAEAAAPTNGAAVDGEGGAPNIVHICKRKLEANECILN